MICNIILTHHCPSQEGNLFSGGLERDISLSVFEYLSPFLHLIGKRVTGRIARRCRHQHRNWCWAQH